MRLADAPSVTVQTGAVTAIAAVLGLLLFVSLTGIFLHSRPLTDSFQSSRSYVDITGQIVFLPSLIANNTLQPDFVHLVFIFTLPELYGICLLSSLNARAAWSRSSDLVGEQTYHSRVRRFVHVWLSFQLTSMVHDM